MFGSVPSSLAMPAVDTGDGLSTASMAGGDDGARTLLVVDDDEHILAAMSRLFRREGYRVSLARGGREGLERLAGDEVGVILVDQRLLDMPGCEFFDRARQLRPDSARIVLTGYTDLASVTDAVNRGAIFKFLTKPWDDDDLKTAVREAFQLYRVTRENTRLAAQLRAANAALTHWNEELARRVEEKTREAGLHYRVLAVSQEILAYLPLAVLGVDPEGWIVLANREASRLFGGRSLLGERAGELVPAMSPGSMGDAGGTLVLPSGGWVRCWSYALGDLSEAAGTAWVMQPVEGPDETGKAWP